MAVTQRRKITRGPNKGDTIIAKAKSVAAMKAGNWWPTRVTNDRGGNSTLRDNPGVKFGKGRKKGGRKKR
jgi:hypothetical protein